MSLNSVFNIGSNQLWAKNSLSIDALRRKSKAIHKDNVFIASFTRSFLQLVISSGVTLRVQTSDKVVRRALKDVWEGFAVDAMVSGDMSLDDALRAMIASIIVDGDVLVYVTERNQRLKINTIQGHRVGVPNKKSAIRHFKTKEEIDLSAFFNDSGVVYDRGEIIGYTFNSPAKTDNSYWYIPRLNDGKLSSILLKSPIILDTDAVRGVPLISSAHKALEDITDLLDSETKNAKIRAKIAGVLKTSGLPVDEETRATFKENLSRAISEINAGDASIYVPYPGTELVFNDKMGSDTNNFILLVKPLLVFVANLYGVSYDALSHDLKDNTSAIARLIYMTAWTDTSIWRNSLISGLLDPFFYLLAEYNKISLDGVNWQINCKPYGYVKSSEEVESNKIAIETNQKTLAEVAAESGKDIEDIINENAEVNRYKNSIDPDYSYAFEIVDRFKDKKGTAVKILLSKGYTQEVIDSIC